MKTLLSLAAIAWLAAPTSAQTPKRLRISGSSAQHLLSLLVSGSAEVRAAVRDRRDTTIVVHDLFVVSRPTAKYDAGDPFFKLGVYEAKGRIGTAAGSAPIGEATALFELFTRLGLPTLGAMDGMSFQLDRVDCRIDVAEDAASAKRFRCEIEYEG